MQFTIYGTDGLFRSPLSCPDRANADLNVGPDEILVEGDHPEDTYLKDGVVKPLPPQGEPNTTFDVASEAWIDSRSPEQKAADLEDYRQQSIREITRMRGQARLAYITDLPGQDMLYTGKYEEAAAYLSDPSPDPAGYPLVLSEVGVTATTAEEVAQVFLNLNALWRQAAGAIDAACFGAEAAVHAATTPNEIDAAIAALEVQLGLMT